MNCWRTGQKCSGHGLAANFYCAALRSSQEGQTQTSGMRFRMWTKLASPNRHGCDAGHAIGGRIFKAFRRRIFFKTHAAAMRNEREAALAEAEVKTMRVAAAIHWMAKALQTSPARSACASPGRSPTPAEAVSRADSRVYKNNQIDAHEPSLEKCKRLRIDAAARAMLVANLQSPSSGDALRLFGNPAISNRRGHSCSRVGSRVWCSRHVAAAQMRRRIEHCFPQRRHHGIRRECRESVGVSRLICRQARRRSRSAYALKRLVAMRVLRRMPQLALGRLQLFLTPALHQHPLRDPRLNVDFNQLVQNLNHLLPQIRAVVQARQFERFQRHFGTRGNVIQHRFRGFHAKASAPLKSAPRGPKVVQHTAVALEVNRLSGTTPELPDVRNQRTAGLRCMRNSRCPLFDAPSVDARALRSFAGVTVNSLRGMR